MGSAAVGGGGAMALWDEMGVKVQNVGSSAAAADVKRGKKCGELLKSREGFFTGQYSRISSKRINLAPGRCIVLGSKKKTWLV